MGKFDSDSCYIYYCGKESLKRKEVPLQSQQKSQKCTTWVQSQNNRMISVHFQGKPFIITEIQVYASTSNAEEAEVKWLYWNLQDLVDLTPKKDALFIIGVWNEK